MKRILLLTACSLLALAQTPIPRGTFQVSAKEMHHNGSVYELSGNVVIESNSFVLRADSAKYDENSKQISAHGDVRVTLK
jgi:lipopolysaccharide assembly outer membrane protein LptD (OstA)